MGQPRLPGRSVVVPSVITGQSGVRRPTSRRGAVYPGLQVENTVLPVSCSTNRTGTITVIKCVVWCRWKRESETETQRQTEAETEWFMTRRTESGDEWAKEGGFINTQDHGDASSWTAAEPMSGFIALMMAAVYVGGNGSY